MKYADIYGAKVIYVDHSTLYLDDRRAVSFGLDGDCCSVSEYTDEGLAAFGELLGATITKIEDREGQSTIVEASSATPEWVEKYETDDSTSWHFLVFTTDKGHVTVDWRNNSNGYYDGSCFITEALPLAPVPHDAACDGRTDLVDAVPVDLRYSKPYIKPPLVLTAAERAAVSYKPRRA